MAFRLEQFSAADFINWHNQKLLNPNPDFQRREVWKPSMQVYLIDTMLRGYSIPKIYIRTIINPENHTMTRDVVDGQQRLKTIFAFANNEFKLTKRAGEYSGLYYRDLDDETKGRFLEYPIAVEHLINADNEYVIQIFARLNQFGVKLNGAELRNAEFGGELRWAVVETARNWSKKFGELGILSISERARMADDELVAEMYNLILRGINAGTDASIRKIYTAYDEVFTAKQDIQSNIDFVINYVIDNLKDVIAGPLKSRTHFILLFAAIYDAKFGIPQDKIESTAEMRLPVNDQELSLVKERLINIANIITKEEVSDPDWKEFNSQSNKATINERSRRIRYPFYARVFSDYGEI